MSDVSFRLGIDIGGTFTDFTAVPTAGEVILWKEDSTAREPVRAIERGLTALAEQFGLDVIEFVQRCEVFVHGTTIATNTVIQRNGPRTGMLCTEGFRDTLALRDGFKPDRFNVHLRRPREFVDRWLRVGVPERCDKDGGVVRPLDEAAVRVAARKFARAEVESVAVAFLWSIVNPAHEQRAAAILREELPGVHVVCSHDVLPEIREWQRSSATVLSAYIVPGIAEYLTELEGMLTDLRLKPPPLIMQTNGGCARIPEILRRPVNVLASGPAAAPAAALHHAAAIGETNLITIDMGGTSLDVCLIHGGRPAMTRDGRVEEQPIGVPAVDCHSIGAGGGSIAWIDGGGALRVGPRSAGARPGPACYGLGGLQPTVTDANVVLGYLEPSAFLGGRRALRDDLALAALGDKIAAPLGLSALEAAAGVVRLVNTNMTSAVRAVSIERGLDPRAFTLVCGGGAGGLHATRLARELGVRRVFVPVQAGTFCSFGMTVTDVRHDFTAARYTLSSSIDLHSVNEMFSQMESDAKAQLLEEGFSADEVSCERSVDARYAGQVHEITVPVHGGGPLTADHVRELNEAFHREHLEHFAYNRPEIDVEYLHWRVAGIGRMHERTATTARREPRAASPSGRRPAYFAEAGRMLATEVYAAATLPPGATVQGPTIVQAATTTVVLCPGDVMDVLSDGSFSIAVGEPAT